MGSLVSVTYATFAAQSIFVLVDGHEALLGNLIRRGEYAGSAERPSSDHHDIGITVIGVKPSNHFSRDPRSRTVHVLRCDRWA